MRQLWPRRRLGGQYPKTCLVILLGNDHQRQASRALAQSALKHLRASTESLITVEVVEGNAMLSEQWEEYILLVDDSEDDARLFRHAASQSCNAKVFCASGGTEAIYLLSHEEIIPSLVVLEIDLPSGDGYALLRFIREHPELQTVPVVILTGFLSVENLDPAWSMGANAVILKPDNASDLRELVSSLCQLWLRFSIAPRPLMVGKL